MRIEIHNGKSEDYNLLYSKMEEYGFSKIIIDSKTKIEYALPNGEYYLDKIINIDLLRSDLITIIQIIKKNTEFLISELKDLRSYNLTLVI